MTVRPPPSVRTNKQRARARTPLLHLLIFRPLKTQDTRGGQSDRIFPAVHAFPATSLNVLPRGASTHFLSVRRQNENSAKNLLTFRPSFHSHTSVPPPEPAPPPLEDDSIASGIPSIHRNDLPNHLLSVSFHSSLAQFQEK
jgi:hypothetical protein